MDGFWSHLFEHFGSRRAAGFFFCALVVVVGTVGVDFISPSILYGANPLQNWPYAVPGVGLLIVALVLKCKQLANIDRENHHESSPLSRDELAKARSKLKTNSNSKSL